MLLMASSVSHFTVLAHRRTAARMVIRPPMTLADTCSSWPTAKASARGMVRLPQAAGERHRALHADLAAAYPAGLLRQDVHMIHMHFHIDSLP